MPSDTWGPFTIVILSVAVAAGVMLIGSAVVGLAHLHDESGLWAAQSAELAGSPSIFAISKPAQQPAGVDIASWDEGDRHFRLRLGPDGTVSLSDPAEPTAVTGRANAPVTRCSLPQPKAFETHSFTHDGHAYRALLTEAGNAAVCAEEGKS